MKMTTPNPVLLSRVPHALRSAASAAWLDALTPATRTLLGETLHGLAGMVEQQDAAESFDVVAEVAQVEASDTPSRALRNLARETLGALYTLSLSSDIQPDEEALLAEKLRLWMLDAEAIVA